MDCYPWALEIITLSHRETLEAQNYRGARLSKRLTIEPPHQRAATVGIVYPFCAIGTTISRTPMR